MQSILRIDASACHQGSLTRTLGDALTNRLRQHNPGVRIVAAEQVNIDQEPALSNARQQLDRSVARAGGVT